MAYRKLAATASLVLAAEAFMIPSTISLPGVEIDGESEFRALRLPDALPEQLKGLNLGVSRPFTAEADVATVNLECHGCSFKGRNSAAEAAPEHGLANDLVLELAVSDDRKTLDLNGLPLFPPSLQTGALTAYQTLNKDPSDELDYSVARGLDYAVSAMTTEAADSTDAQIINLTLSIFGLDDEIIDVGGVDVRMLQDEAGNLNLIHIIESPMNGMPQNGHTKQTEVNKDWTPAPVDAASPSACPETPGLARVMCKLRTKLMAKVHDLRLMQPNHVMKHPCPGRMRLHPQFEQDGADFFDVPLRGGPGKFKHHPHHHHHHHHSHHHHVLHKIAHALRRLVTGFLAPILIGVLAGMTASILGMIVGTVIAWLWVKLVRGGKRGGASARQEAREDLVLDEEEVLVGEKDVLLEHAPTYEEAVGEDLPVYVEKE